MRVSVIQYSIFIVLVFAACNNSAKKYHIKELDTMSFSPIEYYGRFNVVMDSVGNYFFFNSYRANLVGDADSQRSPIFQNLRPEEVIQFSEHNFRDFINLNVNSRFNYNDKHFVVRFMSYRDTFSSPVLDYLKSIDTLKVFVSRTTQEVEEVLKSKKSGKSYDIDSIKWKHMFFKE